MADLPLLSDSGLAELTGTLERVVFHNEENGYTVFRLVPDRNPPENAGAKGMQRAASDPVACVGHTVNPQVGAHVRVQGRWVNNPRFGRQLEFSHLEEMLPVTSEGIRLYLASGLIKGVGENLAGRIVDVFGADTIRILDEEPDRLLAVHGVGKKGLQRIKESWAAHRGIRDLMLFLQPHGITPAYAVRIHRAYGADALQIVRENPYRLAMDIHGIGFVSADAAARSKVMVLTGGPGTGKTTIINAIIRLFGEVRARILLAAPTGRAAKRMSETTGRDARTIHRLLEYSPKEDGFARNEDSPLACALLVVDEASMMDAQLFYHLLKAVPLGATVILVGDVHQLPSVGPGNVLADIIASRAVPVAELTEIFRQSAESEIICNAHLINKGEVPPLESSKDRLSDFYFIRQSPPEKAAEMIVDLVRNHIPRRFDLDPVDDIQVLTPMIKGEAGAASMNRRLQEALNPNGLEVRKGERAFRLHDKVMQIRNTYDKDVFNGDMGRISHMNPSDRSLSVDFDGRIVPYDFEELDELAPAYAISIHKSQGSEYPAVVIPLMMQHYVLLQRNLVYTGVTRGKRLVVLVGESRALHTAIKNNRTRKRHTRLALRLRGIAARTRQQDGETREGSICPATS